MGPAEGFVGLFFHMGRKRVEEIEATVFNP
jgi:hypothetical protein